MMKKVTWMGIAGLSIALAVVLLGLFGFIGAGFDWLVDKGSEAWAARAFLALCWVGGVGGLIAAKAGT
jgi:hypothetical protein